jgi:hypothetical protein
MYCGMGDDSSVLDLSGYTSQFPTAPYSTPTPTVSVSSSSGGSIWTALSSAIGSASSILGARYAVPQLNPGQYVQSGPGGTVQYQLPTGATSMLSSLGSSLGGSSGSLILLLGGGVLLVMLLSKH